MPKIPEDLFSFIGLILLAIGLIIIDVCVGYKSDTISGFMLFGIELFLAGFGISAVANISKEDKEDDNE